MFIAASVTIFRQYKIFKHIKHIEKVHELSEILVKINTGPLLFYI